MLLRCMDLVVAGYEGLGDVLTANSFFVEIVLSGVEEVVCAALCYN